jgi:hypothetical protein
MDFSEERDVLFVSIGGNSRSIRGGRDLVEELQCRNIRDLEYPLTIVPILIPGKQYKKPLKKQRTIALCSSLLVASGNGCVLQ